MNRVCTIVILAVGLLNAIPVIGVLSVDQLSRLYGLSLESQDLIVLLRHRAVLFGLVGAFIIYSVFHKQLRLLACIAGLVSMVSFVLLAMASAEVGPELHRVMVADIVGSIAMLGILPIVWRDRNCGNKAEKAF